MSPFIKSIVGDNEPAAIHLRGRTTIMHRIESRFRFLAVGLDPGNATLTFLLIETIRGCSMRQCFMIHLLQKLMTQTTGKVYLVRATATYHL